MPTTVAVPGRAKQRFTFLPPPSNRGDPLAAVELGKTAEVQLSCPKGLAWDMPCF